MIHNSNNRRRSKPLAEINVVPYIDVMLVLLVIFMITAPMLAQGVKVALPEERAEALPTESQEPLVLTVDVGGQFFLNRGDTPTQAMADSAVVQKAHEILSAQPNTAVLVRGDQSIAYGTMVHAMVLLQQAGAKSIGLVTETLETGQ